MNHQPPRANRLAGETSPYLLQHAHNPVDWYPWGEEALARARAENKPIFLSIGYAACHWCHVMERESFEDPTLAAFLNDHFIAIKVDREERPDLDDIHMQAVQMLTGHGGWPMSVFLTPRGLPFFGGTYFPPQDRHGMPGFGRVLEQVARVWRERPESVEHSSEQIAQLIAHEQEPGEERAPDSGLVMRAARGLVSRLDRTWGGFGGAPKFPPSMSLSLLLRHHAETGDAEALEAVTLTLRRMARGGLCDQLGGGFHRYSVDDQWLVPHFEKMLYDNALLAPVYLDGWLATGEGEFRAVAFATLDYVLREMTHPDGGFYSSQDADSEGAEGKYYIWRPGEVEALLGREDAGLFCAYYGITSDGNWQEGGGASILNVRHEPAAFAQERGMTEEQLEARLASLRPRLLAARAERVPPLTDDKVIVSWNGLMISALARGTQAGGGEHYALAARRGADFIQRAMRDGEGDLLHVWRAGRAQIRAFLEDYANLALGLIDLYETTFDGELLERAAGLVQRMLELFEDPRTGGFFTTDGRDPTLSARVKDTYDGATPAGNSSAVHALLRLGLLLDRADWRAAADRTMAKLHESLAGQPAAHHHMLGAAAFALAPPLEVAIVGKPSDPATRALIETVWRRYLPARVLAAGSEAETTAIALLRGKRMNGDRPTATVCRQYTCREPVTSIEALAAQLEG